MEVQDFAVVETGEWADIVAFCRDLSSAFNTELPGIHDEFEAWRPKTDEGTGEVRERTNDRESIQETRIEQESQGTAREMTNAGRKVKDSGNDMLHGHPRRSLHDVEEAGSATARGLIPLLIRFLRRLEHIIYHNVVGPTSPDFFETEQVTVTIEHQPLHGDRYHVRASFSDRDILEKVAHSLGTA